MKMSNTSVIESVGCKICGNNNDYEKLLEFNKLELAKCNNCGVVFANKRVNRDILFNNHYKYWTPSMLTAKNVDERLAKEKNRLFNAIEELNIIKKYKETGKILDIGAANGTFLFEAKRHSFIPFGTELSKNCRFASKTNYDIDLMDADITEVKHKNFDVIVLWNVLEHLYNPVKDMLHLNSILNKDGIILIKIPFHSYESLIKYPMLPEHVFNYNENSLKYLTESTHFNIIEKHYGYDNEIPTLVTVLKKWET